MERRSDPVVYYALAVAVIALVVSLTAYRRGRASAPPTPRAPATVTLSMVVATFTGQGVAAHRWFPAMMVVREGDTIDLAVANPDRVHHQFEITGYNMRTDKLAPGSSARLRFTVDQSGVFVYRCVLPHDPAQGHCTLDHDQMLGYLIVTP